MFFLLKRVYHKVNDLSRGKWENFGKILSGKILENFKLCEDIFWKKFMMNYGEKFLKIDIKFSWKFGLKISLKSGLKMVWKWSKKLSKKWFKIYQKICWKVL